MIAAVKLPVTLPARNSQIVVRRATPRDLHAIMRLLADDAISAGRGDSNSPDDERAYAAALERIIAEPNNELIVVVDARDAVVGTLQLTAIPGMARRGSTRILVEAVRVLSTERRSGIGGALMRWVMDDVAAQVGASIVQLTSDAAREDAHRFYTRLGFVGSHVGFKYNVPVPLGGQPPKAATPTTTAWSDVRSKRSIDEHTVSEHVARMDSEERAHRLREIRED